jgi:copper resistance protein B
MATTALAQHDQHPPQHQHQHEAPAEPPAPAAARDTRANAPSSVVPITDAMRRAAFPEVHGHAVHDSVINSLVLVETLEWRGGRGPGALAWSATGWVGGDLHRLWVRSEGGAAGGDVGEADAHVLYGRAVSRWWDVVAGVRQDLRPAAQTWLAAGIQGLAPGFFDVEATAYVSDAGQLAARFEVEYDVLLTNRLVVQPTLEANLYGRTNEALGVGSGLSEGEAGIRMRYHLRRELAPYVGVSWVRRFGRTRDFHDDERGGARFTTGVRLWF